MLPVPRKFKKGEIIFNEGDSISNLILIQSGKVKTFLPRSRGEIEFQSFLGPAVFGDHALFGINKHIYSAIAQTEVSIVEMPLPGVQQMLESAPQFLKLLIKSIVQQSRSFYSELKTFKLETDPSPCSDEYITRLFGGLYHYAIYHSDPKLRDSGVYSVSFHHLKQYTQRVFGLNPEKVENACHILKKLSLADYIYGKVEEEDGTVSDQQQLKEIHIKHIEHLDSFVDFFQYNFFKSGKKQNLKVDENLFLLLRSLIHNAPVEKMDRNGYVSSPLQAIIDELKNDFNISLSVTHWQLIEQRGLFSKRSTDASGNFQIQFHYEEFFKFYNAWRFLREIKKWNTANQVSLNEPEVEKLNQLAQQGKCQECGNAYTSAQKFCGECGAKLVKAA